MNNYQPILYTEKAQCQDCYKCLRQCSAKAIRIHDAHAMIMHELCVGCGKCVEVCPVGAKKVRDDIGRARLLLNMKERVIVSLAPSWTAEFEGMDPGMIIHALKKLGFHGVSETALGAQEVSAHAAQLMQHPEQGLILSSACPTAVEYIKKYHPEHASKVMSTMSPVLAHARMLRAEYGDDIGIVFIGPCVSKKLESDTHQYLLDVVITFEDIRRWWTAEKIDPYVARPRQDDVFIPRDAREGALYPVDGGMVASIKASCEIADARFMAFSGLDNIKRVLADLDQLHADTPVFIELMACEGGCVNGPSAGTRAGTARKRFAILNRADYPRDEIPRVPTIDIGEPWEIEPVSPVIHTPDEIRMALQTVGKYTKDDELNCGGCGYDSCREFARALLDNRAEPSMCAGYMRQLAHKKANALIRTMPSGVVIVDQDLRIVESNHRFVEILGGDLTTIWAAQPGLEGASLKKVVPFHDVFEHALKRGADLIEKELKLGGLIVHLTVFSIERHYLVGGIIQDVTKPAVQKERIVNKARDVITRNLQTVQQIAYLLGENAAESEVILNSIIESFPTEEITREQDDDIR